MERKKTGLLILGLSILLLSVVGITYAYWNLNLEQTDKDNLATSCFNITMDNEHDAIKLEKAYPIEDSEGESLTPYSFTITNNCNANAKYQINLESLNKVGSSTLIVETDRLKEEYLKVKLNEVNKEGSIHLLSDDEVEHTLDDAYESHKLTTGYLGPNEVKTYELRLWMNGDLEADTVEGQDAMNKTFASKITIVATYAKEAKKTLVETILAITPEEEDSGNSGIYEVTHDDANITYTTDPFYQNRLTQTERRYAGKEPNNYVSFGETYANDIYIFNDVEYGPYGEYDSVESCEEDNVDYEGTCEIIHHVGEPTYWRIIGIVNTPEGQRVKLIKDESIGKFSWDTSASNVNKGLGVNEWSQSDLMKLLNPGFSNNKLEDSNGEVQETFVNNSLYWDGGSGKCYISEDNTATDCYFTNNKMPNKLKNMIETITWNVGASDENYETEGTVSKFYEYERSSNTGKICDSSSFYCNDKVDRTTSWKGKVGLIYPSDYVYATNGEKETENNRTSCFEQVIDSWSIHCNDNNWLDLLSVMNDMWTISPYADSRAAEDTFINVGSAHYNVSASVNILPSVYLKPDVFVTQGDGSKESPFILGI